MNVILSAAGTATDFMMSLQRGLAQIMHACNDHIAVVDFTFNWVALKLDSLLSKGLVFSDFEDLRSVGL